MATAWVRSLSCKSTAVADDVYSSPKKPQPKKLSPKKRPPPAKGSDALLPAWEKPRSSRDRRLDGLATTKPETKKEKKKKPREPRQKKLAASSSSSSPAAAAALLAMTELPEGHSSRRVVELIFASGWGADDAVPEVEALFRVHATARAAARFEDARLAAALAPGADARCAADGNEMMRFQCLAAGGGTGEVLCAAVATCRPGSAAVRAFASSGAAHAGAAGAGEEGEASPRRRGMLVCRVLAGRVRRAEEEERHEDCDSVDNGGGELVVLDSRAVLPCFLVVYRATSRR